MVKKPKNQPPRPLLLKPLLLKPLLPKPLLPRPLLLRPLLPKPLLLANNTANDVSHAPARFRVVPGLFISTQPNNPVPAKFGADSLPVSHPELSIQPHSPLAKRVPTQDSPDVIFTIPRP